MRRLQQQNEEVGLSNVLAFLQIWRMPFRGSVLHFSDGTPPERLEMHCQRTSMTALGQDLRLSPTSKEVDTQHAGPDFLRTGTLHQVIDRSRSLPSCMSDDTGANQILNTQHLQVASKVRGPCEGRSLQ